jgi:hypothetical protein
MPLQTIMRIGWARSARRSSRAPSCRHTSLRRDYNMDLRFATFVGFIVDMDPQYDVRVLGPRLFPLALNSLPFFRLCERSLHG